jgi:hypothetical protein
MAPMKTLLIAGYGGIARRAVPQLEALAKGRILPARVACVSTSGVYGDCGVPRRMGAA